MNIIDITNITNSIIIKIIINNYVIFVIMNINLVILCILIILVILLLLIMLVIALISLILVLLPSLLIVLLILLWMLLDFLGFPRFSSAAAGVTAAADQRPGAWGVVDVMGVVGGLPRTLPRARGVVHLESSVFDRGKFNVYTPATRTRTVGFYFMFFPLGPRGQDRE